MGFSLFLDSLLDRHQIAIEKIPLFTKNSNLRNQKIIFFYNIFRLSFFKVQWVFLCFWIPYWIDIRSRSKKFLCSPKTPISATKKSFFFITSFGSHFLKCNGFFFVSGFLTGSTSDRDRKNSFVHQKLQSPQPKNHFFL